MGIEFNNPRWIIANKAKRELIWWKNEVIPKKRVAMALKKGIFVPAPTVGESYRLIFTLRSEEEPRIARPETLWVINEAGRRWRNGIGQTYNNEGFNPNLFFLSVFSLYRDEQLQRQLQGETVNAVDISAHQAGAAADIDPNGFYYFSSGRFFPINPRSFHPDIPPEILPHFSLVLWQTLQKMEEEKLINLIVEYRPRKIQGKSTLSCFHISPNPELGGMINNIN